MRNRLQILATLILTLAGCDGVYIYPYSGQLIDSAGNPLAKKVVAVAHTATYDPVTLLPNMGVLTDAQGHFSGNLYLGTFWVLSPRPPSPILDRAYLYVQDSHSPKVFTILLKRSDQPAIGSGEHRVNLGRVMCPGDPFTPA